MLRLSAWIVDTQPEISRQLLVDPGLTLEQLHQVLQAAFGWTNSHMHQFHEKNGTRYAKPSPMDSQFAAFMGGKKERVVDERKITVGEVFDKKKKRIAYEYDFGDSWMHGVELEAIVPADEAQEQLAKMDTGKKKASGEPAAVCLRAEMAGPPEDCGGIPGYYHLIELKELAATKGEKALSADDREMLDWLGEYDPKHVDISAINKGLARVRIKKSKAAK